jgi:hypothetical protein
MSYLERLNHISDRQYILNKPQAYSLADQNLLTIDKTREEQNYLVETSVEMANLRVEQKQFANDLRFNNSLNKLMGVG